LPQKIFFNIFHLASIILEIIWSCAEKIYFFEFYTQKERDLMKRGVNYCSIKITAILLFIFSLSITACAPKFGNIPRDEGWTDKGQASWYGKKFHGRRTASGEIYDMYKLTAAHRTLPFGTIVKVVNLKNDKSVVVRITDRGPAIRGRIIDLSYAAAKDIDMINDGVVLVKIRVINSP